MRGVVFSFIVIVMGISGCGRSSGEFTIWIGGAPREIEFWEELIEEFREETGIDVVTVRQPTYSQQRIQSLIISLKSEQRDPDVYLMDIVWINQFIRSGWLESLNKYIERDSYPTEKFFSKVLNSSDRYEGEYYAFPVFVDAGMLYYRSDLLKKYGYEPPTEWRELVRVSKDIIDKERGRNRELSGYVWQGAQYEGLVCSFIEFINSNGGGIGSNGRFTLRSAENVEALKFMRELIHEEGVSPENTFTEMKEEEVRRAFQRGDAVFERNWAYAYPLHESDDSPVKGKTGVTELPAFAGHKAYSVLGGWHAGISAYSDHKEEAWELLKFITSYEMQKRMLTEVGWNPARKDVYEDAEIRENYPHLVTLSGTLENAINRPALAYYPQFSDILQRFVNECIAGNMSAEEALAEAEREVNRIRGYYE